MSLQRPQTSSTSSSSYRDSLSGSWRLDKTKEGWSMRHYLAVMEVDPLAIEAHDRAEQEADTIHTITVVPHTSYRIVKRSRVNNDLVTELPLDESLSEAELTVKKRLSPGDRLQTSRASSRDGGKTHISILSTIETVNGTAVIVDTKELVQETGVGADGGEATSTRSQRRTTLRQTLVITNQDNHKTCKTTRHFVPVDSHGPRAEEGTAAAGGAGDD